MWKIFDDYYLMKRYPVLLCTKPLNLNYEWCWKDSAHLTHLLEHSLENWIILDPQFLPDNHTHDEKLCN